MGTRTVLGKRCEHRFADDQCAGGDGGDVGSVQGPNQKTAMPDSGRRLLRMEEARQQEQAAVLLHALGRVGVCLCWDLGPVEGRAGNSVETCSIITTTPNALTADVHDRMPAILRAEQYDLWLDPGMTRTEDIVSMLQAYSANEMKRFPVSSRVNVVTNDDESCAEPVEEVQATTASLF